jgi:hypothetical protein
MAAPGHFDQVGPIRRPTDFRFTPFATTIVPRRSMSRRAIIGRKQLQQILNGIGQYRTLRSVKFGVFSGIVSVSNPIPHARIDIAKPELLRIPFTTATRA